MTHTIMSKKTYATAKAARKAAAANPRATGDLHNLPSGRFCYMIKASA
jgi:hypothetical protein